MRIDFTKKFSKQLLKAPWKVQNAFKHRFDVFLSNHTHPLLRNHVLTGEYIGCRSISITGDWRAICKDMNSMEEEKCLLFIALGTHSQLYR